ncbi:uncharacterized protein LOC113147557 [Cyclospora cayetanensis]|uniref:Uncharacterized protein LOC113147557 n=1 Tax=Cyclospora cayetanensis TaxID=88456 RepID=A0A6P6S2C8_9EIME|nr:uncharacterized protein LOC113147557 [Cyclospora cayetanensis]
MVTGGVWHQAGHHGWPADSRRLHSSSSSSGSNGGRLSSKAGLIGLPRKRGRGRRRLSKVGRVVVCLLSLLLLVWILLLWRWLVVQDKPTGDEGSPVELQQQGQPQLRQADAPDETVAATRQTLQLQQQPPQRKARRGEESLEENQQPQQPLSSTHSAPPIRPREREQEQNGGDGVGKSTGGSLASLPEEPPTGGLGPQLAHVRTVRDTFSGEEVPEQGGFAPKEASSAPLSSPHQPTAHEERQEKNGEQGIPADTSVEGVTGEAVTAALQRSHGVLARLSRVQQQLQQPQPLAVRSEDSEIHADSSH